MNNANIKINDEVRVNILLKQYDISWKQIEHLDKSYT